MRRRAVVVGLVALMSLILSGCQEYDPVGMTQRDGRVFVSLGCERPDIVSFFAGEMTKASEPGVPAQYDVIWEIESREAGGSPLDTVELGVIPDGFVEVSSLANLDWRKMYVRAEGAQANRDVYVPNSVFQGDFSNDDGLGGWAYQSASEDVSLSEYRAFSEPRCMDYQDTSPAWLRAAVAASIIGLIALAIYFVIRHRRAAAQHP